MKIERHRLGAGLVPALLLSLNAVATAFAGTTIDTVNRYAYSANAGWIDGVAGTNNGAVIGEYVCSGYLYAANLGWINLGSGSPANQIQYQNNSATDFGVNQDGLGNLTGFAYGANIGGWFSSRLTDGPASTFSTASSAAVSGAPTAAGFP
jgi:hypothetical protein